ncbi:hypothetical protein FRC17_009033 [Serendipita sp. 399]|nr:hypothetical protein FRC17_009033 [Serendipita sp. 399]
MSSHPYSENNPVPTIQGYEEDKKRQEKQLEAEIERGDGVDNDQPTNDANGHVDDDEDKHLTKGQKEKKDMMAKMNANKEKPTDTVKRRRGERVVDDPVTGEKVIIKDAQFKGNAPLSLLWKACLIIGNRLSDPAAARPKVWRSWTGKCSCNERSQQNVPSVANCTKPGASIQHLSPALPTL